MGRHSKPPKLNRDHARPRTAPAPTAAVLDARLTELLQPASFALVEEYRRLGCRWRVLSLPVMVCLVVTLIWRQVASVSALLRVTVREGALWTPPLTVSQQALSQRLRCFPPELFAQLFDRLRPTLHERAVARARPLPPIVTRLQTTFPHIWIADATTLAQIFRKVGLCHGAVSGRGSAAPLAGKLLALLDVATKLPIQLWVADDPDANEKRFLPQLQAAVPEGVLLLLDAGF